MAASLADGVLFTPASTGTGDFVVAAAVQGYMTPAGGGAVNGKLYRYRAESADLSQWETGYGVYTSGTTTLARTVVAYNSAGTTAKINFSTLPQVGLTFFKDDILSFTDTQAFSTAERKVALSNLYVPPTVQTFLTGGSSGTYTTPSGVSWLEVRAVGGGGGSAGSGTTGATNGTNGGNTTFGSTVVVANGGGAPAAAGLSTGGAGGTASVGAGATAVQVVTGGGGVASNSNGATGTYPISGAGGSSALGGGGSGGGANSAGGAGAANTGGGAGGIGANNVSNCVSGAAAGAGGFAYAIITSPSATYAYAVGAGGTGGSAGTSGNAGVAGGTGGLWIVEHYI